MNLLKLLTLGGLSIVVASLSSCFSATNSTENLGGATDYGGAASNGGSSDGGRNLGGVASTAGVASAPQATGGNGGAPSTLCGARFSNACARTEYCSYPSTQPCGATNVDGTCIRRPEGCVGNVMPVCGCDGKSYSNPCEAMHNGVPVKMEGACP
jgi:hypothetical protein